MTEVAPLRAFSRPPQKFRPIAAFRHFRKLVDDKEDTAQVFYMGECLPSPRYTAAAADFCRTEKGRALIAAEPYLPDLLDDHDRLLRMPAGSVAQAYVAFMRREGLTAAGLVEASIVPGVERHADQMQWFADRLRDLHDLAHILTGYGRDALGEQCVLGFTSAQYFDRTEWIIAWAGALEMTMTIKSGAPIFRSVGEARRHGAAAAKIYEQDVGALLAEPLEEARLRMGIGKPRQYELAHQRLRERGFDPYNLLAATTH